MKISVLVPVFNEENTVIQILEKVNKQNNLNFSLEIIVIDDGSTDRSRDLLSNRNDLYLSLIHI